jgi:hypothetical protein
METFLELAHFLLGVLIVLPLAVLPFVGVSEVRARNASGIRQLSRATTAFGAIGLLVGLMGILLVSYIPDLTIFTPWLGISCVLYAIALGLTLGVTAPRLLMASESVAAGTPVETTRVTISGIVTVAFLAAVVVLMVWKP